MTFVIRRTTFPSNMHYLLLTKLEYPANVSLKLKGMTHDETEKLQHILADMNANFQIVGKTCLEVDLTGIEMLNLLAEHDFGYRVVAQSMAMENFALGGRSFQIEKVIWTLEKM